MGIDLSKVKNKLKNMKSKRNNSTNRIWKPQEGTQKIRIVPYRYNKDYPFMELYFHYDLPGRSHLSPISFGEEDPIVEFAEELKRKGGKENYQLANKLMPKMRIFAPVVVRGEEEKGVRFWGFGKRIYQQLLNILAEPEWGDYTDLQEGRDMKVEYIPREKSDTQFPKTNLTVLPEKKPLAESKDQMKELIESQVKIEEVFNPPSYEELEESLNNYLNPEDEDEEESATGEKKGTKSDSGVDVDAVTDEFSDIFDE